MPSKLKNHYKLLIEDRKQYIESWHNHYKEIYDQVQNVRMKIEKNEYRISADDDREFLQRLIYEKANGVASRGQSVLSMDNFDRFIRDTCFLSSLEHLLTNPDTESYKHFEQTWIKQGRSRNPVLVNRVAAACTLNVSTTVDVGKFNQVFDWLIDKKIIPPYPKENGNDWFSKNSFLMRKIHDEFTGELEQGDTDKFYLSQFVWILYENISNPFSLKKEIIKYGPPGTGKTFNAKQQTELLFDIWKEEFSPSSNYFSYKRHAEFVQFHSSYSYEDFMEGLRPVLDQEGKPQLKLQNGVFKRFCQEAGQWEIEIFNLGHDLENLTIQDIHPFKNELSTDNWRYIFEIEDRSKKILDVLPPFFFIVDEINRAELSRVFGELMYCLEYRGAKHSIKTQYANLNNEETGMIKTAQQHYEFFIPTNVYLIGTMNTIDRSVESFDFALRRRFRWEEVISDMQLLRYHLESVQSQWTPLADNLEKLNNLITKEPLLGNDYQIGHAYLMNLNYSPSLTTAQVRSLVWDELIQPLLQEYLRGTGKESELLSSYKKEFGA